MLYSQSHSNYNMKKNKIRNISEKTILTALVNLKCVGYFGKCLTHLTYNERGLVIDTLIERGYIDNNIIIQPAAKDVILKNLELCQY